MQRNRIAVLVRSADDREKRAAMKRVVLAAALVMAYALPARATYFGMYFVHGKGVHELANIGTVYSNYWHNGDFLHEAQGCTSIPYDYSAVDGTVGLFNSAFGNYATMGCWAPCTGGGFGCDSAGNPCDHTAYILGVGEQIAAFLKRTGVTDLVVVTHSMGGNVIRAYLSNFAVYDWCAFANSYTGNLYDPFCRQLRNNQRLVMRTITKVLALHTPFTGSEAADASKTLSGSWYTGWIVTWLSPNNPSLRDCTTAQMNAYNNNTFTSGFKLYGVSGSKNWAWPMNSPTGESFAWPEWIALGSALSATQVGEDWQHPEDYQLAGVAGLVWPSSYSDGLVSWPSQMAVTGQHWWFKGQQDQASIDSGASQYKGNNHHHARLGWAGGGYWCPTTQYSQPVYTQVCGDPSCGWSPCRGFPLGSDEAEQVAAFVEKRAEARCGGDGWAGSGICNSWCLP